jgi:hypothetical protein
LKRLKDAIKHLLALLLSYVNNLSYLNLIIIYILKKTILSDRYGSRSLQVKIHIDDYKKISENLSDDEKLILNKLYELDENSITNQYYLLKSEKEILDKDPSAVKKKIFKN